MIESNQIWNAAAITYTLLQIKHNQYSYLLDKTFGIEMHSMCSVIAAAAWTVLLNAIAIWTTWMLVNQNSQNTIERFIFYFSNRQQKKRQYFTPKVASQNSIHSHAPLQKMRVILVSSNQILCTFTGYCYFGVLIRVIAHSFTD